MLRDSMNCTLVLLIQQRVFISLQISIEKISHYVNYLLKQSARNTVHTYRVQVYLHLDLRDKLLLITSHVYSIYSEYRSRGSEGPTEF